MTGPTSPPSRSVDRATTDHAANGEVVTLPKAIEVLDFGEDGEWLAAPGHHDLDAFLAAVDAHTRDTWGEPFVADDWDPPKHTYYRPITLEDCRVEVARCYPDRVAPAQLRMAEAIFETRQEEGWVYPCDGDYAGSEPWTEVRM